MESICYKHLLEYPYSRHMKKYNIFKEKNLELSKIKEESSCSIYKESSTFLRSCRCPETPTKMQFNFLTCSQFNEVKIFFITITKKKFSNVYYGYDSTSFCLVRYGYELKPGQRYIIYGKLSKLKLYFIDCICAEEIVYKDLCYFLV